MTRLRYGFSKIADGNMAFAWGNNDDVIKNRKKFLQAYGMDLERSVMMNVKQHGSDIYVATNTDRGKGVYDGESSPVVDALLTNEKNLPLLVLTADCYPIIFHDSKHGAIGLAHAGWRGVHQKIAQKVIGRMQALYGTMPEDVNIVLGPGIKPESYVFDGEVEQSQYPEWRPYLRKTTNGMTSIDLPDYIIAQCKDLGIEVKNIHVEPVDTATNKEYFSHYRSVRSEETEGRLLTVVTLT